MATGHRDNQAEPRHAASHEEFLSKLFTRASTVAFLAISGAATAIALGYAPFLDR